MIYYNNKKEKEKQIMKARNLIITAAMGLAAIAGGAKAQHNVTTGVDYNFKSKTTNQKTTAVFNRGDLIVEIVNPIDGRDMENTNVTVIGNVNGKTMVGGAINMDGTDGCLAILWNGDAINMGAANAMYKASAPAQA